METHGKGKEYTSMEEDISLLSLAQFMEEFGMQFNEFCRHIVVSWYLNNMKVEMAKALERRCNNIYINSDFAQNVVVQRKNELADQYFHRGEILLFGGVASIAYHTPEGSPGDWTLHLSSHLVSSDYRCTTELNKTVYYSATKYCIAERPEAN